MEISKVLLQHAAFVFKQLPQPSNSPNSSNSLNSLNSPHKRGFFQALPAQFDRAKYIEVASHLQIPESTADKQIARFFNAGLLTRQTHGNYAKNKDQQP
jgi:hypothetical protein